MIIEQSLFGTVLLSDGNKITVSPTHQDKSCVITVERNGYENSFSLSKLGIGELIDTLQKYNE